MGFRRFLSKSMRAPGRHPLGPQDAASWYSGRKEHFDMFSELVVEHCRYLERFQKERLRDHRLGSTVIKPDPPPDGVYGLAAYIYEHMKTQRFRLEYQRDDGQIGLVEIKKSGFYLSPECVEKGPTIPYAYEPGYHRELTINPLGVPFVEFGCAAGHIRRVLKNEPIYVKGFKNYSYPVPLTAGKYELWLTADTMDDMTLDVEENFIGLRITDSSSASTFILETDHKAIFNERVTFSVAHDLAVKPGMGQLEIDSTLVFSHWSVDNFRWIGEENRIKVFLRRRQTAVAFLAGSVFIGAPGWWPAIKWLYERIF